MYGVDAQSERLVNDKVCLLAGNQLSKDGCFAKSGPWDRPRSTCQITILDNFTYQYAVSLSAG